VPTGQVNVGTGGSQVTVAPRCGTSPGGHTDVVGGAHGVAPHAPCAGGCGAGAGTDGASLGGGGGVDGAGSLADEGGGTGVGTTVGGFGVPTPGCTTAGSSDVVVETACAALSMLAVSSGDVGNPEHAQVRTEIPATNVLKRITSTSLPNSAELVSKRRASLQRTLDAFALWGENTVEVSGVAD
jgi:hypothetical protein